MLPADARGRAGAGRGEAAYFCSPRWAPSPGSKRTVPDSGGQLGMLQHHGGGAAEEERGARRGELQRSRMRRADQQFELTRREGQSSAEVQRKCGALLKARSESS